MSTTPETDRLGNERNRMMAKWERAGRLEIIPFMSMREGRTYKFKRYLVRVLKPDGEYTWAEFKEQVSGPFVSEEIFAKVALLALLDVPLPELV